MSGSFLIVMILDIKFYTYICLQVYKVYICLQSFTELHRLFIFLGDGNTSKRTLLSYPSITSHGQYVILYLNYQMRYCSSCNCTRTNQECMHQLQESFTLCHSVPLSYKTNGGKFTQQVESTIIWIFSFKIEKKVHVKSMPLLKFFVLIDWDGNHIILCQQGTCCKFFFRAPSVGQWYVVLWTAG